MNLIATYLDSMFAAYPSTPRLLEAKAELLAMMEDAYTERIAAGNSENEAIGQVIRDFGNLDELAPTLGITTDLQHPGVPAADTPASSTSATPLPASPTAAAPSPTQPAPAPAQPAPITLSDATAYADAVQRTRYRTAGAIALFVLAPIPLITLPAAAETGRLALNNAVTTFFGVAFIIVMVAIGVLTLVRSSRDTAPYARVVAGTAPTPAEVTSWVNALAQQHEPARTRALQTAIVMWICAPLPLLGFAMLGTGDPLQPLWIMLGVAIILVLVAAGLFILLPQCWAHSLAETLNTRATDPAHRTEDEDHSIIGVIASFYWPTIVVVFLLWSFIGDAWGTSWIIWPVAGIIFGAVSGGMGALTAYRERRR